ncbi:hypothetical protein HK096_001118 [Nowakowskiella sp. JEL0078]|nr:hypothetical protein HK096_001118 [Nowakowskiella sp. JEL0078]
MHQKKKELEAVICLQSAFRSFRVRKEMWSKMSEIIVSLRNELSNKDFQLQQTIHELKVRTAYIEQTGKRIDYVKELSFCRKQLSDLTSTFESKISEKDLILAHLDLELKTHSASSAELRRRLALLESMRFGQELRDGENTHKHGMIFQELEELRYQVYELRAGKELENITISMKNKEIQDLQTQMITIRKVFENELALKSSEIDDLRDHLTKSLVTDQISPNQHIPDCASECVTSKLLNSEKLTINTNLAGNRSIWAPIQPSCSGKFTHFPYEIPSPTTPKSSNQQFPVDFQSQFPKSIWNVDADGSLYGV